MTCTISEDGGVGTVSVLLDSNIIVHVLLIPILDSRHSPYAKGS